MDKNNAQKVVLDARMIFNSGIGRYIQAIIPALIDQFSNVTLLGNPELLQQFEWAPKTTIIEVTSPIYSISEQISLLKKTPKCDIFISPHYNAPMYLPQAKKIAVIIPDANHLVFRKELSVVKRLYATLFYQVAISKDIIFTISDFSKDEIVKYTGCSPDKILVAKCAIDKDHFKKMGQSLKSESAVKDFERFTDLDYILFIGNIKPHKNLKRALLGFKEIAGNYPNLKFLLVGKKDNFLTGDNEILQLVENDVYLKDKVEFTGYVSDVSLALLYKNAKIFLFPSLYEGFGLPPLEAMYFGCPVIVSREGSLPEICGNAAYYCNAYDVKDIGSAIDKVLSEKNLRDQLISDGFKKVDEYDWAYFNKAIIEGLVNTL